MNGKSFATDFVSGDNCLDFEYSTWDSEFIHCIRNACGIHFFNCCDFNITYGSISAAAKHLYVSQSTISLRIQYLKTIENIQILTIASVDAVNNYTFVSFFQKYMEKNPDIRLDIRTYHSNEIYLNWGLDYQSWMLNS